MNKLGFVTTCVNSTASLIDNMTEHPDCKQITLAEFVEAADCLDIIHGMGYSVGEDDQGSIPEGSIPIEGDYTMREAFYRSIYDGRPCVYMVQSAIEYIFAEPKSEPLPVNSHKDLDAIRWDITADDMAIVDQILNRAETLTIKIGAKFDRCSTIMDIVACHLNGCPLRLQDLLDADNFNFCHDVFGTTNHINRKTGKIENCFLPRFHGRGAVRT